LVQDIKKKLNYTFDPSIYQVMSIWSSNYFCVSIWFSFS